MKDFCLIAHRCGPGMFPEQSIMSARHALSLGADMVEMDVQYTSDGIPVICHDMNTLRMFGVDSLVSDMSYRDFMSLRQVQDCAYPSHSLENIFKDNVYPTLFHCKISGELLSDLAQRIVSSGFEEKCVIGVLNASDVNTIKRISSKIKVLSFMPVFKQFESFLDSNADFIRLWEDWVEEDYIKRIHEKGKKVWIMAGKQTPEGVGYTSEEKFLSWLDMKVDGILVNDVKWALDLLKKRV